MHPNAPTGPRRLTVLVVAIVALGGQAALAAEPDPPIVHDPEAAAELAAAFEALWALPSFRQSQQDLEPLAEPPRWTEHFSGGRMRMLQEDTAGPWQGTTETIIRPGRAAVRFVSPALDAHLAKLAARQRTATLVSIGSQIREILQGAALGPVGALSAGLSLLGTARGGLSAVTDADAYGRWHCTDLPELPIPGAAAAGAAAAGAAAAAGGSQAAAPGEEPRVERLPATTLDGEAVRGYRSATEAGGATLGYRTWVLESNGLPRRSEMSIDMPGFRSRSVMEFTDHGSVEPFENPPCLDQGGARD